MYLGFRSMATCRKQISLWVLTRSRPLRINQLQKRSTCQRDPRSCLRSHFSHPTPPPIPMGTLLSAADSHRRRRMPSTSRDSLTLLAVIQRLALCASRFPGLISSITGQSIRCVSHRGGYPEGALGRKGELRGYQALWVTWFFVVNTFLISSGMQTSGSISSRGDLNPCLCITFCKISRSRSVNGWNRRKVQMASPSNTRTSASP